MAGAEEFEQWKVTVEERLDLEAGLRASQDHRDLSELKAEVRSSKRLIQALAVTQSDHTRRLTRIESTLVGHGDRLGGIEGTLVDQGARLRGIDDSLRQIVGMLDHLIQRG